MCSRSIWARTRSTRTAWTNPRAPSRQVSQARTRPGAGPRHLTFHPGGRFAYLANELDNTVTVCAYDPATGG